MRFLAKREVVRRGGGKIRERGILLLTKDIFKIPFSGPLKALENDSNKSAMGVKNNGFLFVVQAKVGPLYSLSLT